ncbi:MAG: T9SS type A sorting domain-containing protein [Hymenobacteraceae bacterium]|nr:T9SS type A sorting domain-containing protein [Hymenobacteraceae bacterium]
MQLLRYLFVACIIFETVGSSTATAQNQTWQWAIPLPPYSAGNHVQVNATALDAQGNMLVTGDIVGSPRLGSIRLVGWPNNHSSFFLGKLSSTGQWLWAVTTTSVGPPGNNHFQEGNSIAVDSAGNIFVLGWIYGGAQFGSLPPINAPDNWGGLLVKLDANGNWLWTKTILEAPGAYDASGYGKLLLLDPPSGDLFAAGMLGIIRLDPTTGSRRWTAPLVTYPDPVMTVAPEATFLTRDPTTGDLLLAGTYKSSIFLGAQEVSMIVGPDTLTNAGRSTTMYWSPRDIFIARFDAGSGAGIHGTRIGGPGTDVISGMVVDSAGRITLTALYTARTLTLGTDTLNNPTYVQRHYVAQLGPRREWRWTTPLDNYADLSDLSLTPRGNVATIGRVWGRANFGNGLQLTASADSAGNHSVDGYVATLNPANGHWLGGFVTHSTRYMEFSRLHYYSEDAAAVVGWLGNQSSCRFGSTNIRATVYLRMFIARYHSTPPLGTPVGPVAEAWTLNPNPAHQIVRLAMPSPAPISQSVAISDALGRTVRTARLPAAQADLTLDLAGLAPGLYLVRCGAQARRLVVE